MRTYSTLMTVLVCVATVYTASAQSSDTPEQIAAPITTSFGTYTPYVVPHYSIRVGLSEPTIAGNFSNVETAGSGFTWNRVFAPEERMMLQRNNFLARPEPFGTFGQAYVGNGASDLASFITVDAVLHGLRTTIDEANRQMERDHAAPTLEVVLNDLSQSLAGQLDGARNQEATALRNLLAYVQTARVLLTPTAAIDNRVSEMVYAELEKINAMQGIDATSILPGKRIDYSKFRPEGHYDLNQAFRNYYRTRTWLGEFGFELRADSRINPLESRMALTLARTMDMLAARSDAFRQGYQSINEPITFFTGRSEQDVSWDMLAGALRGYYGTFAINQSTSASDSELVRFVGYLADQLPGSDIRKTPREFRLLPRSSAVNQAMWGTTGTSGLKIMGALGSARAAALTSNNGDIKRTLLRHPVENWVKDLGWSMLYTVSAIPGRTEETTGYPRFMRNDAWKDRELASVLGAWIDYQHEPSQLSVQTGTAITNAKIRSTQEIESGYVEPDPQAWAHIAELAGYLRNGLVDGEFGNLIDRRIADKLRDIENVSANMMQIAARELQGEELSGEQLSLLASMPQRIAAYETFTDDRLKEPGMSIVAGRIAGAGSAPANGHPIALYVITPRNDGSGGLMLTRGAIYSYYETDQSNDQWIRSLTTTGTSVRTESWTSSFLSGSQQVAQNGAAFRPVEASIPAVTAYTPSDAERKRAIPDVQIDMESNVVRRSVGELWFTVRAPRLNGIDIVIIAVDEAGHVVHRSAPARIENGERYDLIPVDGMRSGQYFVRVVDPFDRTLASGRFMVVR